jgi:hypothetical protein
MIRSFPGPRLGASVYFSFCALEIQSAARQLATQNVLYALKVPIGCCGTVRRNVEHEIALTIETKGDAPMPRELIEPHKGDKRYVRRKGGKFTTRQTDVGRSLAADRRSKAKTIVKKGEGDRGDRRTD